MRVTWASWRALRIVVAVSAVGVVSVPSRSSAQVDALGLNEVLELRRSGVSIYRVVETAREYCLAFAMSDSVERRLVETEADTALLHGLRQACILTPTPELPPGVLYDDDFTTLAPISRFSRTDQLCTAQPHSRGLRLDNRRQNSGCVIALPSDIPSTGIRIELTIAELNGDANALAVLGFGKHSGSWDQFTFALRRDAHFEFGNTIAGRFHRVLFDRVSGLGSTVAAEHRLAVDIQGRTITLYLNGRAVGTYRADESIAHGISLGAGPRSDVIFSRLLVKRRETTQGGT